MTAIDGRTADKIASTLRDFGWLVRDRGRAHTYQVYPPGGGLPLVVGPGAGREAANTLANLRRCGIEFDPKRRDVAKRGAASATAGGPARPAAAPTSPAPPWAKAPVPVPVTRELPAGPLPGWVLAMGVSPHAFDRMDGRRISEHEARVTVAYPDHTRASRSEPGRLISVRGDVLVVSERDRIVTVMDRLMDERDVPRSPAAPMPASGTVPDVHRPRETVMSTSDKIRNYVRSLVGEFAVSEVVADLDDPLASSGLVSQVVIGMMNDGDVRRVGRGRYVPTAPPAATPPDVLERDRATQQRVSDMVNAESAPPAPAEPAARPTRAQVAAQLVVDFEWAEVDPPRYQTAAATQKHQLTEAVQLHLDQLKQHPGRWATLATFPAGTSKGSSDERKRALRERFPGCVFRVVDRVLYVMWKGE